MRIKLNVSANSYLLLLIMQWICMLLSAGSGEEWQLPINRTILNPYKVLNYVTFGDRCPEFINRSMTKYCSGIYKSLTKWKFDDMMARIDSKYNIYQLSDQPGHFMVFHNIYKTGKDCFRLFVHHYTLLGCDKSQLMMTEAVIHCIPHRNDLVEELLDDCRGHSMHSPITKTAMYYPDGQIYAAANSRHHHLHHQLLLPLSCSLLAVTIIEMSASTLSQQWSNSL